MFMVMCPENWRGYEMTDWERVERQINEQLNRLRGRVRDLEDTIYNPKAGLQDLMTGETQIPKHTSECREVGEEGYDPKCPTCSKNDVVPDSSTDKQTGIEARLKEAIEKYSKTLDRLARRSSAGSVGRDRDNPCPGCGAVCCVCGCRNSHRRGDGENLCGCTVNGSS